MLVCVVSDVLSHLKCGGRVLVSYIRAAAVGDGTDMGYGTRGSAVARRDFSVCTLYSGRLVVVFWFVSLLGVCLECKNKNMLSEPRRVKYVYDP